MAIDFKSAQVVTHLTSGNNFWVKLQSVLKGPGEYLLIQNKVNAGGGVRGQRLDYFMIFNAQKEHEHLQALGTKGISLVQSPLLQSAPVHESVLKGILAVAKKGDRKLVDIGHGLILGQIDITRQAFPTVLGDPNSSEFSPLELDTPIEATDISWNELFNSAPQILGQDGHQLMQITDLDPQRIHLGALWGRIPDTSPVAKFEISIHGLPGLQNKLVGRMASLEPGQYIRVHFIPSKKSLFLGDLEALAELQGCSSSCDETVRSDLFAQEGDASQPIKPDLENPNEHENGGTMAQDTLSNGEDRQDGQAQKLADGVTGSAAPVAEAGGEQPESPFSDLTKHVHLLPGASLPWTKVRSFPATVPESIKSANGYIKISFRDNCVGIGVSNELLHRANSSVPEKLSYASSDIGDNSDRIIDALRRGQAVAITRYAATQYTILPINNMPTNVAKHILRQDLSVSRSDDKSVTPMKDVQSSVIGSDIVGDRRSPQELGASEDGLGRAFSVAASATLSVPADLKERIAYKQSERALLAELEKVNALLKDPKHVVEVKWNDTLLQVTSNPTIISSLGPLTEYFSLEARELKSNADQNNRLGLAHAFHEASLFDGVVVHTCEQKGEKVLVTRNFNFFEQLKSEFF